MVRGGRCAPRCGRANGRRHDLDPGDRPAAPALRDRPDLRGRRPRHDQRRDGGGARRRRLLYLLGTRERSDKLVRDVVLADTARAYR